MEYFVAGTTTRCAADLVGVNFKTAAFYFHRLREIIAVEESNGGMDFGELEVDESYFSGKRKGKRGRGPQGKCLFWESLKEVERYTHR